MEQLSAVFEGSDSGQELFHVSALQTAIGTYPQALVRSSDMLAIDFDERSFSGDKVSWLLVQFQSSAMPNIPP
jgi:hypothetical protein